MAGTLVPVGYEARARTKAAVIVGHVAGSAAAGMVLGALFGAAGSLVEVGNATAALLVGTFCLLYAVHEAALVRLPAPQFDRQVPHGWRLRFRPAVAATLYGAGLGVGLGTLVPVTTLYAACLAVLLAGDPRGGLVALGAYGLFRALPSILMAPRFGRATVEHEILVERLWAMKPVVALLNALALAFAGAVLLVAVLARAR